MQVKNQLYILMLIVVTSNIAFRDCTDHNINDSECTARPKKKKLKELKGAKIEQHASPKL